MMHPDMFYPKIDDQHTVRDVHQSRFAECGTPRTHQTLAQAPEYRRTHPEYLCGVERVAHRTRTYRH